MAILEVQDIHTYYGDAYVLQGLSLQLEQGQILGPLGRNGVGKTTLVNSIVGFNPPRRGRIVFKGDDITQKASFETVRSGMGLMPQGRRRPDQIQLSGYLTRHRLPVLSGCIKVYTFKIAFAASPTASTDISVSRKQTMRHGQPSSPS